MWFQVCFQYCIDVVLVCVISIVLCIPSILHGSKLNDMSVQMKHCVIISILHIDYQLCADNRVQTVLTY